MAANRNNLEKMWAVVEISTSVFNRSLQRNQAIPKRYATTAKPGILFEEEKCMSGKT